MRIGVILQGEESRQSAGVRIRYDRLSPWLTAQGHALILMPIDTVDPDGAFSCDIYLFCKCHDVRALLLADAMKRRGAVVGVDLFDDYYTQTANSRFVHLRDWLQAILPDLTFALCSTDAIRERLEGLLSGLPLHILNDPYERFDAEAIRQAVARNIDGARRTRQLDIGWFGMGDNPHLPVGLHDLKAHGDMLLSFRRGGYRPRLTILTNRRALSADRLEMISRLGVPYRLEEWSEALERDLVGASVACLLSVNAQPFSVVKSINRAITTLTGGSQVLSAGFPLYAPLEPFIYRDPMTLLADIEAETPALRDGTIPDLAGKLSALADPEIEAQRLLAFLGGLSPALAGEEPAGEEPAGADMAGKVVLFGRRSADAAFLYVKASEALSVASPYAAPARDYDISLRPDPVTGLAGLLLSERASACLPSALKPFLQPVAKSQYPLFLLPGAALSQEIGIRYDRKTDGYLSVDLSQYAGTMRAILTVLEDLFPARNIFVSESGAPFSVGRRPGDDHRSSPSRTAGSGVR